LGAPRVFGSILCSLGALIALPQLGAGSKNALFIGTIVSGVGLAMVALPSLLTIRPDHKGGFLTLTYRSLLTKAALKLVWRPEVQRHPPKNALVCRTEASKMLPGNPTEPVRPENDLRCRSTSPCVSSGYGLERRTERLTGRAGACDRRLPAGIAKGDRAASETCGKALS
jgi:hypothetical protein